ncbi:unnamed protein product [Urochloa humidicola]
MTATALVVFTNIISRIRWFLQPRRQQQMLVKLHPASSARSVDQHGMAHLKSLTDLCVARPPPSTIPSTQTVSTTSLAMEGVKWVGLSREGELLKVVPFLATKIKC